MENVDYVENMESMDKTPSIMRVCTGYHAGIMRGTRGKLVVWCSRQSQFSVAVGKDEVKKLKENGDGRKVR